MSHIVTISLEVKDLTALAAAAKAMGGELMLGQTACRFYGGVHKVDHVIRHPNCKYDVGLRKNATGSYDVVADEFSPGGLPAVFGAGMQKLKQRYGVAVASQTMRKQGWTVLEKPDAKTGDVRLVCTRM
jgi:hypothetical protein